MSRLQFLLIYSLLFPLFVAAQKADLNQTIELKQEKYSLKEMVAFLETSYHLKFAYQEDILKTSKEFKPNHQSPNLQDLLKQLEQVFSLEITSKNGQFILKPKSDGKKFTISGYVSDALTGERLPGTSIFLKSESLGVISNAYGFYSLAIPEGSYTVCFSYLGYALKEFSILLTRDMELSATLSSAQKALDEVQIISRQQTSKTQRIETGLEQLSMKQISELPSFLGEVDVLKGMQQLPGVTAVNDGISLLSVRGGTYDQNLVLLDEAPVYNPTHVLGFFSVFNPDAVTSADIYKGYIPSRFGGRLSSVIDVHMKEGNRNKRTVTANVNLFASRLTIESPILNENTSILVSGRYAYTSMIPNLGKVLSEVINIYEYNNYPDETRVRFWDWNLKVNHKLNAKNHLYLSTYSGNDYFFYPILDKKSSIEWGNTTGTLRWNHQFNSRLFSNTSLIFSNYNYAYQFFDNGYNYDWMANMKAYNLKSDFDFYINPNQKLEFGASANRHFFVPGKITPTDAGSSIESYSLEEKSAWEMAAYLSYRFTYQKFSIESGLRLNAFYTHYQRDSITLSKTYPNLAPRISAKYQLTPRQALKIGYTRTYQYLHLLNNATIGLPTDLWLPADAHIKPQQADQISGGYSIEFVNGTYELGCDAYYKKMNNIIDFVDNANLFMQESIETEIKRGGAESYGLEIMFSKKMGRLKGNLSYTLAKTEKTIEGINNGEPYPVNNDNRHSLTSNVFWELGKRWTASANFTYTSGGTVTIPESYYMYDGIPFTIYSERNGYRLPANHKLDLGISRKSKAKPERKWESEFMLGVNNVYNRKNVFALFFDRDNWEPTYLKVSKLYLFGRLPYASFTIKF